MVLKRITFVGDLQAGIVFSLWGTAGVSLTQITRTRELEEQDALNRFTAFCRSFHFSRLTGN